MSGAAAANPCPNCGAPLADAYCARCGQRAPAGDDLTARRFFGAVTKELSESDSRLWRTALGLFVPGELTRAFLAHQWRRYFPPLRLYLVISGLFFLFAFDVYHVNSLAQMRDQLAATQAPPGMLEMLEDPQQIERIGNWTSLLRFAGVLLMGAWVALLQLRSRRPLGAHLVFATHYYCFDFALYSLLAIPVVLLPQPWRPAAVSVAVIAGLVLLLAYAVCALRRAYGQGWGASVLRGAALIGADLVLSSLANGMALGIVAAQFADR